MANSTIIVEVRQRVPGDLVLSRELGFFSDAGVAAQTIDWLYREVYKAVMQKDFIPDVYLSETIARDIQIKGFHHWMTDDLNGGLPIFYTVEHRMYNGVPIAGEGQFVLTVSDTPFSTGVPILP